MTYNLNRAAFEAPTRSSKTASSSGKESVKALSGSAASKSIDPETGAMPSKKEKKSKEKTRGEHKTRKAQTQSQPDSVPDLIDTGSSPCRTATDNGNNNNNNNTAPSHVEHSQHLKKKKREKRSHKSSKLLNDEATTTTTNSTTIIDVGEISAAHLEGDVSASGDAKSHKKKHKKDKSQHKEKQTHKSTASEYEQPMGISTPSKEIF